MRPSLNYVCLLGMAACAGCCSLNHTTRVAEAPAFSEAEIRSKTWDDNYGHRLQLLEWTSVKLPNFDELRLAKYGDASTGFVTCLEVYRVSLLPGGTFLSLENIRNTQQQTSAPGSRKSIPERQCFVLLDHDNKPGMVTHVASAERGGEAFFNITRETVPDTATRQREGLRYTLICDRNYRMRTDLEYGTWDIPERNTNK